jgi:hypothetical protein
VNKVVCSVRILGSQNGVPRKIFGPKSDEMTRGCRKLHNEELHDLYPSRRWAGREARMGEKRNVYNLLLGGPEGKRPL